MMRRLQPRNGAWPQLYAQSTNGFAHPQCRLTRPIPTLRCSDSPGHGNLQLGPKERPLEPRHEHVTTSKIISHPLQQAPGDRA
jgi:hypothetical protein